MKHQKKAGFEKKLPEQRDGTIELTVRLKTEIDSGKKLNLLSKERRYEIKRLNKSRELSETRLKEKEKFGRKGEHNSMYSEYIMVKRRYQRIIIQHVRLVNKSIIMNNVSNQNSGTSGESKGSSIAVPNIFDRRTNDRLF